MPNYEYECTKCNTKYDKFRSMNDDDPGYSCDTCNVDLVRVYFNVGITFNGPGFYKTDNRKV